MAESSVLARAGVIVVIGFALAGAISSGGLFAEVCAWGRESCAANVSRVWPNSGFAEAGKSEDGVAYDELDWVPP